MVEYDGCDWSRMTNYFSLNASSSNYKAVWGDGRNCNLPGRKSCAQLRNIQNKLYFIRTYTSWHRAMWKLVLRMTLDHGPVPPPPPPRLLIELGCAALLRCDLILMSVGVVFEKSLFQSLFFVNIVLWSFINLSTQLWSPAFVQRRWGHTAWTRCVESSACWNNSRFIARIVDTNTTAARKEIVKVNSWWAGLLVARFPT